MKDESAHIDGLHSILISQKKNFSSCRTSHPDISYQYLPLGDMNVIGEEEAAIYDSKFSRGNLSSLLTHQLAIIS